MTIKLSTLGSGGGSEIGDIKPLLVDDVDGLYVNSSDESWLRSGVIETDTASYPGAKISVIDAFLDSEFAFTSFNPTGLCELNGKLWTVDTTSDSAQEFNQDGTPTGNTFAAGANPVCITTDGTNFWVGETNSTTLTEYTPAGTATGNTVSIADSTIISPSALGFDGVNLLVVGNGSDNSFWKYATTGGVGTQVNTSNSGTGNEVGGIIVYSNSDIGLLNSLNLYRLYDSSGNFIKNIDVTYTSAAKACNSQDNTELKIIDGTDNTLTSYTLNLNYVGFDYVSQIDQTPFYVRIK